MCRKGNMTNIGTLKLVIKILITYLILLMVVPSIHAIVPFKAAKNKRLSSPHSLISTKTVHSGRHCSHRCSQNSECKAFNVIQPDQEDDSAGLQCEMHSHTDREMVVDDENAIFYGKCYTI